MVNEAQSILGQDGNGAHWLMETDEDTTRVVPLAVRVGSYSAVAPKGLIWIVSATFPYLVYY